MNLITIYAIKLEAAQPRKYSKSQGMRSGQSFVHGLNNQPCGTCRVRKQGNGPSSQARNAEIWCWEIISVLTVQAIGQISIRHTDLSYIFYTCQQEIIKRSSLFTILHACRRTSARMEATELYIGWIHISCDNSFRSALLDSEMSTYYSCTVVMEALIVSCSLFD